MANYPFDRNSDVSKLIIGEVMRRSELLISHFVPDFPLTSERIEELLNPPEIMKAVYTLRSLSFANFSTYSEHRIAITGDDVPRGLVARINTPPIIISHKYVEYFHKDYLATKAFKKALKLDRNRMTQTECEMLREWCALAVKYRRKQALMERTTRFVLEYTKTTYDLIATWPTLHKIVNWRADRNNTKWYQRFSESPRSPTNYNCISKMPINFDIDKRIAACDVLLLQAEFLKPKEREGLKFELWQWADLDNDPHWLHN